MTRDDYQGAFTTALAKNGVLTAVRIPVPPAGHSSAYEKMKLKVGDYATAAAAVMLVLDGGACRDVRIALTNLETCRCKRRRKDPSRVAAG